MFKLLLFTLTFILSVTLNNIYAADKNTKEDSNTKDTTSAVNNSNVIKVIGIKNINYAKDYNENVQTIPDKNLKQSLPTSLNDVLQKTPYATVSTVQRGVVDMRGQGVDAAHNIQFLIDDVPINIIDTSHYFQGYNVIPPEAISSIDIIPGGGSIIYGNGTQGGVISIRTPFDAYSFAPVNSISGAYGSFNTKRASVFLGQTLLDDKLLVQFGHTGENSKAYLKGEYSNNDYYMGSVKYKITPNQVIGYKYSTYSEDGAYSGVVQRRKDDDWRKHGILYKRDTHMETNNFIYQGRWDLLSLDDKVFYNKGRWHTLDSGSLSNEDQAFAYHTKGNKLKGKIKYNNWTENNKRNYLLLGNDYIKNDQDADVTKTIRYLYNKDTLAFFALNHLYLTNQFYTDTGVRYNRDFWTKSSPIGTGEYEKGNRKNKNTVDSKALSGVIGYEYSKDTKYYTKIETGFNAPDALALTDKIDNIFYPNNIKYETYITYEVGGNTKLLTNTNLSWALYNTDTKNEIQRVSESKRIGKHYYHSIYSINLGKTNRKGVELNVNQNIFSVANIFFGGSYVHAKLVKANLEDLYNNPNISNSKKETIAEKLNQQRGEKLTKVPNWNLVFGYDINLTKNIKFTNSYKYLSSYTTSGISTDDGKDIKVDGYMVSDLDITYAKNQYTVGIGTKNLFNKKYYLNTSGNSNYDTIYPGMERNYYMSFRYTF